jgi:hypothetical protein
MSMTMYIHFTCLVLLFLTSSSQASISNAIIQADAVEITRLNQMFISSSPPAFHQMQSLVCEMINSCCPSIKSSFNEYTGKSTVGGPNVLLNACIGSQSRQNFFRTCPMIYKILLAVQNQEFLNYTIVLLTTANQISMSDIEIERPCSPDEAYASYCKWNQQKQLESCEQKTLMYVAEHNSNDQYKTYIQEVKSNIHFLINSMKSAFPMKNNKKKDCLQQFKTQKNQRYPYANNCKYSSY